MEDSIMEYENPPQKKTSPTMISRFIRQKTRSYHIMFPYILIVFQQFNP